ncbi:MAG: serpin family protein [candidate division WOR-3 bacterium]|nr:serpin family protein [candidate division WOR-3 bacterium]
MSVLLAIVLISSAPAGSQPAAVRTAELVQADNRFGLEVFDYAIAGRPGENVFISPLSIALALQMTMHGAAGATLDAMAGALGVSGLSRPDVAAGNAALRGELLRADKKVRLEIANSLWLRAGTKLQKRFADDCGKYYRAAVSVLDFARPDAVTTINNWIDRHTGGRIKQAVSRLLPEEIVVLINAIYFKGSWTKGFNPKLTSAREFHLVSGGAQRLMMNREGRFRYKADDAMQAVALPYGDGRLNMYLFLPREQDGLAKLIEGIKPDNFADLFVGLNEKKGGIVLPRFKIEYEQILNEALIQLGMGKAFGPDADFSGMVAPPQTAAISDVLHKTFIEVNEEGTEAAAVTVVRMRALSMPNGEERFSFVCDHPFLCAIRDDVTGSVLFLGAIFDPKQ